MLLVPSEVALLILVKSSPNSNFYCVLLYYCYHLVSIFMVIFIYFVYDPCITHFPFITFRFVFFVFIPLTHISFKLTFFLGFLVFICILFCLVSFYSSYFFQSCLHLLSNYLPRKAHWHKSCSFFNGLFKIILT